MPDRSWLRKWSIFVYGIKSDAISIAEFIGVAAKLMP